MWKPTSCLLVVVACGQDDGARPRLCPVALGHSGFVVDVPAGWTVKSPIDGIYQLVGGAPAPQIIWWLGKMPTRVELRSDTCRGHQMIEEQALPGGGLFVTCKGPSAIMKGVITTKAVAMLPNGTESMRCQLETDGAADVPIRICRSLRKRVSAARSR